VVRFGGWLFRHRTAIPVPLAIALLGARAGEAPPQAALTAIGLLLVASGELVRMWGVRHIGVVSRTRSDRLGPLVESGPFGLVRNPLYVGNIAIWTGFALLARLIWMAPLVGAVLALEYHAIVRWEEELLASRLGNLYRGYRERVPRWVPTGFRLRGLGGEEHPSSTSSASPAVTFSWPETLFSERGTLIAIGVGLLLIWIKLKALN
jgi:protein-S-isoprenylcysteine O-methyltransferase Ste14